MAVSNEAFRVTKNISDKRRGLLMAAVRYVEGYAENENNHPQARDCARDLIRQIKEIV